MVENSKNPTKQAPLVGHFKGPQNNEPRRNPESLQRNVESQKENVSAKKDEEDIDAGGFEGLRDEAPEPKPKTYIEGLEDVGLTVEKARVIRDAMILNHFYEEDYLISNKLHITFRTRFYGDAIRLRNRIEAAALQYPVAVTDMIAHCSLAASLRRYGKDVFDIKTKRTGATETEVEDAFEERLNYIQEIPAPILNKLVTKLQEFDNMVAAVFNDGAPEDF